MVAVTISGNTIDLADPKLAGPSDASKSNFILLQCKKQLELPDYGELAKLKVEIQELIGEYTYLCRYKPSDLNVLRKLPYVSQAQVYPVGFVKHAILSASKEVAADPNKPIAITIRLHDGVAEDGKQLFEKVKQFAAATLVDFNYSQLRILVPPKDLNAIAALDQVRSIEQSPTIGFQDKKVVDILYGLDESMNFVPSYRGAGQLIAVADSGFDRGTIEPGYVHPAFQDRVIAISDERVLTQEEKDLDAFTLFQWNEQRKLKKLPAGDVQVFHPLSDRNGHGTHVAGCAVAITPDVQTIQTNPYFTNTISSPAPKAKLYFQVVNPAANQIPNLPDLFTFHTAAKIHSNSWGAYLTDARYLQQPYSDSTSHNIDKAMFKNSELLILFCAGNDGNLWTKGKADGNRDYYRQIGSEGAAKNCITVGATFNRRIMQKSFDIPNHASATYSLDDDDELRTGGVAGIFTEVADFSNKGPTVEGRIKPDLVAPGVGILSARTRAKRSSSAEPEPSIGEVKEGKYMFMTGTSQATPIVAGSAAVLRGAYLDKTKTAPSGALIKAMLINGAVDLAGTQWVFAPSSGKPKLMAMPPAPNPVQGFGLVNLARSLDCLEPNTSTAKDFDMPVPGHDFSLEASVPKDRRNLRVTMAYTDRPGRLIQEILELQVTGGTQSKFPDAVQPLDYQKKPGVKAVAGCEQEEVVNTPNNVQKITWKAIPTGINKVMVKVQATRRILGFGASEPRKFALCYVFSNY